MPPNSPQVPTFFSPSLFKTTKTKEGEPIATRFGQPAQIAAYSAWHVQRGLGRRTRSPHASAVCRSSAHALQLVTRAVHHMCVVLATRKGRRRGAHTRHGVSISRRAVHGRSIVVRVGERVPTCVQLTSVVPGPRRLVHR